MVLSDYVYTFGEYAQKKFGQRIHKLAINAAFTCPNRDGTKGIGGCTFCNNRSFSPNGRQPPPLDQQIENGRKVIAKRTRASKFIAYFQAYTNTYADINTLKALYDQALTHDDVIGLSIGTRPDCVPPAVLDLLCHYRDSGNEIWLELGLQSASDKVLERVNRGHGLSEYRQTLIAARKRGLQVCTHLIAGLPGEQGHHLLHSLNTVLDLGVDGLKIHPLHVVRGTRLAITWRRGDYQPIRFEDYVQSIADVVEITPADVVFHRLTGTANTDVLIAPQWCQYKWKVLNAITDELARRKSGQASACMDSLATSGN